MCVCVCVCKRGGARARVHSVCEVSKHNILLLLVPQVAALPQQPVENYFLTCHQERAKAPPDTTQERVMNTCIRGIHHVPAELTSGCFSLALCVVHLLALGLGLSLALGLTRLATRCAYFAFSFVSLCLILACSPLCRSALLTSALSATAYAQTL